MTSPSSPQYGTATTARYRSSKCDEAGHQNSHITKEAAQKCGGKDAELATVSRYWGTIDGVRCSCKFGHLTAESALRCVGGDRKPAAKVTAKPTAKKSTGKPATAKPRALRSVSTGAASRA